MKTDKVEPGFPHRDTSWLFGLIAVRGSLAQVKRICDSADKGERRESHAFEINTSEYSMLSWDKCEPDLAKWFSRKLKTTVAYVWDEDTSGWFGYSIFRDGAEVEAFQFGANYEDELGEFASDVKKRRKGWDVFVGLNGEDFQFRSKLARVTQKDLLKGLAFVDDRFKRVGVPIPRDFPKHQEVISCPFHH